LAVNQPVGHPSGKGATGQTRGKRPNIRRTDAEERKEGKPDVEKILDELNDRIDGGANDFHD